MLEPGLGARKWLTADKLSCKADKVVSNRKATETETMQPAETCQQEHLERIGQLEQALEQSLTSSNELRQMLRDQHLLENQLAATEEIANLQQQVINELKQRLVQQQQSVDMQSFQTRLHYVYRELERERDSALERLTQFEEQTVSLQEQLLQQSQQVREYEATVQYWKEQYLESLQIALQLKKAIEELALNCTNELTELLTTVQSQTIVTDRALVVPKLPSPLKIQPNQVDLPAFLTRHRKKADRVGMERPPQKY